MSRDSLKSVMRLIDVATAKRSVEDAFLDSLKKSIEMTEEKNATKSSQSYKPSAMRCIRAMYYMVSGKDEDDCSPKYTNIGICNSGSDIHQRIQRAVLDMKSNGFDCEYINVAEYVESRNLDYLEILERPDFENNKYETKLYHKGLNMRFLCDGIIRFMGKYYLLELKTEASHKWIARSDVDPKHYDQGTAYALSFGIDDVIFIYINRDILDMKSYMFNVTDDMKQSLVGKIEDCDNYVVRMIAPPKPELPKGVCTYCSYRERCKNEG